MFVYRVFFLVVNIFLLFWIWWNIKVNFLLFWNWWNSYWFFVDVWLMYFDFLIFIWDLLGLGCFMCWCSWSGVVVGYEFVLEGLWKGMWIFCGWFFFFIWMFNNRFVFFCFKYVVVWFVFIIFIFLCFFCIFFKMEILFGF